MRIKAYEGLIITDAPIWKNFTINGLANRRNYTTSSSSYQSIKSATKHILMNSNFKVGRESKTIF